MPRRTSEDLTEACVGASCVRLWTVRVLRCVALCCTGCVARGQLSLLEPDDARAAIDLMVSEASRPPCLTDELRLYASGAVSWPRKRDAMPMMLPDTTTTTI